MVQPNDMTLYSYRRCPFAMRVRFTLHEKGIPFTVKEEDLKNKSSALLELHPEGRVPLLVHGTHAFYESSIITEYIEDLHPNTVPLMPKDAGLRAEVRLWTYWCNTIFKPDVDRLKYGKSRAPESECIGIEAKVETHLRKMEETLASTDWLVGNAFSLADIHVFPFCRQLWRTKPEPAFLKGYPHLENWIARIQARPAFTKTMEKTEQE